MQTSHARRTALCIAALAAFLALFVHSYLASVHYDVQYGAATGDRLCNVGQAFNCEAVSASKYAEFLGVPMADWGFAANLGFLGFLGLFAVAGEGERRPWAALALAVAVVIATASAVMGGISALVMTKYCLFCIAAYGLSFVTVFGAWRGLRPALASARWGEVARRAVRPAAWTGVGLVALTVIGNSMIKRAYGEQDFRPLVNAALAEWRAAPVAAIEPVAPLVLGAARDRARLTVVEFADFRCIHCKHAVANLHAFVSSRSDVRFLFQAWPLDGACNPGIPSSYGGASCELARAAFCAAQQHDLNDGTDRALGWAAHHWMYDHQDRFATLESTDKAMEEMPAEIGLQVAAFKACLASDEAKDVVLKQSAVGDALKIGGTPTIYANGRRLPSGQLPDVLKGAYDASP